MIVSSVPFKELTVTPVVLAVTTGIRAPARFRASGHRPRDSRPGNPAPPTDFADWRRPRQQVPLPPSWLTGALDVYYLHMNSAAVIKRLRRAGWVLRRVKGSHHHFTHPTRPGVVTVPHPRRDVMLGTLRDIFRQAGWKWGDR